MLFFALLYRLAPALVLSVALAACGAEPEPADRPAPTDANVAVSTDSVALGPVTSDSVGAGPVLETQVDPIRLRALGAALDTLEALVITLEQVKGPIAAWNQASEAARLLRYLEQNRAAFALDMPKEEAARRYPKQIARLNALEARRTAALERINSDLVTGQVLAEEMAKADAEAKAAGQ